jgi:gluconate kinase
LLPVFFMENYLLQPSGFLIAGVSGSGKSTFGKAPAPALEWDFFDAVDFHSAKNIAKMSAGTPLTFPDYPFKRVTSEFNSHLAGHRTGLECLAKSVL